MTKTIAKYGALAALGLSLGGCLSAEGASALDAAVRSSVAGQSAMNGPALDRAIATANAHPLGSPQNPVRAGGPSGQQSYLLSLRCPDGRTPAHDRRGNVGIGVFGNVVDEYSVTCMGSAPVSVRMDMYHRGYVETRPVPGFTMIR